MSINFPSAPALNQTYSYSGRTWRWNGEGWALTTTALVNSDAIEDGAIVNADIAAAAGIVDTKLATISTAGKVANSATTATSANTASAIVARDASGNFSAATMSAQGLAFPATQIPSADANTLDDYEEGTWTPVIQGTTSAGVATGFGAGTYSRIGRMVFVIGFYTWSAHTGTGNLRISGLPFTLSDTVPMLLTYETLTVSGTPFLQLIDNQTYGNVLTRPTAGGTPTAVAMDTAATIYLAGCYRSG
jgi:hypothetical protein